VQRFARLASVAFALAALAFGVMKYSNSVAAILAAEGPAPNMVEVCSGECTVKNVSIASARFQLNAGGKWSQLKAPTLPLDVSCKKSCAEFGGHPDPKAPNTLYAERLPQAYTIIFLRDSGPTINRLREIRMSIPAAGNGGVPRCVAYMPSSKSGIMPATPCGTSADSSEYVEAVNVFGDVASAASATGSAIAGQVLLPDGGVAAGIPISITGVLKDDDIVTGRWVASTGVPNTPWVILLSLNGKTITGSVDQNGGQLLRPIEEGRLDGNTVRFKAANLDANAKRRVTFTGKINADEITLTRDVEVLPGGQKGGNGIWGTNGPASFTARRDVTGLGTFSVQSGNAGQYRALNLPPGHYLLSSGPQKSPTYYPGVTNAKDAVLIKLGAKDNVSGLTFRLVTAPEPTATPRR
jgi:hypothetical protein